MKYTHLKQIVALSMCVCFALAISGCKSSPSHAQVAAKQAELAEAYPRVELRVEPGHTVRRSMVQNDNGQLLQWVVIHDGEVVMERNARETIEFRYPRQAKGVYTIYMQQLIDGAYRVISNVVSYRID